ncbi:ribonuclease III [[Bacteroides] pectinophilus]|jgi:ribonuclease-3 family protein|uniref:Mini-ribonuclease 3 n=2 Tax=[Bacteroides] pectinophilus TaxID=384638 RepID=B7ASS9_9FIRM|nr:RNase3 domain protein [[Bacteroides] pectinophilus ATCC 43243]MEE0057130.1 ribonuclease III domain-containing protein [[Bacteroides] pectinophilus]UWN94896.1 ribonuclease III [[Bacteroides] pectinophilus]CDD56384.1 mini-ribonuclease 3 [Bacteroides pectinophilus CAG:437]HBH92819.1 ribonuclease III [Bacteroides sp.]
MEEKLIVEDNKDFIGIIRQVLDVKQVDVMSYSPLTLAYIGDDAYDLVIRTYLLGKGNMPVNKLNRMADGLVRAKAQSDMMDVIEPMLDEEEHAVYKRGRNAKSYTKAKNATVADYRRATGFEALMGYLYLQGRYVRMVELIRAGIIERLDADEI